MEIARMSPQILEEANQVFQSQVSSQIARVTAELKRMEDLLHFGMVDRRVLSEFRHAVDRIRTTGWQVERWLDRDERGLHILLTEERVRMVTRLATQLAGEPGLSDDKYSGVPAMKQAIHKLYLALPASD
jgi:hypothetical protein